MDTIFFLGMNGSCSVHEWVGPFMSEMVSFKMTSVCGHVMSLDFIGKYNNWDKVDPVSREQYLFVLSIIHRILKKCTINLYIS